MQVQSSTLSTLFLCLFHCTRNTMNIFIYLLKSSFQNLNYPQPNLRASSPDKKCWENIKILHNLWKNPANILSRNSLMETLNTVWLSWSTLWLQTTYLTFILVMRLEIFPRSDQYSSMTYLNILSITPHHFLLFADYCHSLHTCLTDVFNWFQLNTASKTENALLQS